MASIRSVRRVSRKVHSRRKAHRRASERSVHQHGWLAFAAWSRLAVQSTFFFFFSFSKEVCSCTLPAPFLRPQRSRALTVRRGRPRTETEAATGTIRSPTSVMRVRDLLRCVPRVSTSACFSNPLVVLDVVPLPLPTKQAPPALSSHLRIFLRWPPATATGWLLVFGGMAYLVACPISLDDYWGKAHLEEENAALKLRLEGQRRAIHELEHQANTLREDARIR